MQRFAVPLPADEATIWAPGFVGTADPIQESDGRTIPKDTAVRETARRPAGFVEGNRGIPQPRRDHGPALGEAGGDARSPAPARQDGLGLRFSGGIGRVGAQPESSSSAGKWEQRPLAKSRCTTALGDSAILDRAGGSVLALAAAVAAGDCRRPLASENGVLLAKPDRRRTISDRHGLRWSGAGAAVSRDGHFVAFLSDRDGPMDVWVTQVGSGEFHNLTHGSVPELVNPSIRTLGFSPDGSLVTFWVRKPGGSDGGDISIWAVPTLGGAPRPYLEGVAEFDWSHDGSRLAYHTPGPGDPLFVSDGNTGSESRPIFTAPAGLHCHFPLWAPDAAFIYFVQGSLPDKLDIWRISPAGGTPERITSHNGRVSHPVLLDRRTLMYLASDPDGSGPWLYSMDVERRIPHRLTSGLDRYTSLAASADGRRLVATLASPKRTLWRLRIADSSPAPSTAARISLTTSTGFSPRLGPNYLLYVSAAGASESIWKLANGTGTELWSGQGAQIFGGPAIAPDGRSIAFSVRQHGQTLLYVMQADGTNARIVSDSLDLQGAPAWAPDGQSITSAADDHGVPHLFRVPLDGRSPALFVEEYAVDPAWSPDGRFVVYSGPDIGTTFSVKAVTADGSSPSPACPDPDAGGSTPGLPGRGTGTRVPARRDSA